MNKTIRWIDNNFEIVLMSLCLIAITVLCALQVVLRYCFSNALSWVEEVVVYLNVWLGFIGCSLAVLLNNNLRVDLNNFLPKKVSITLNFICGIATFIFYVYIANVGIAVIKQTIQTGQVSPASEIPLYWLYGALLVGSLLASFRCLQRGYRNLVCRNKSDKEE